MLVAYLTAYGWLIPILAAILMLLRAEWLHNQQLADRLRENYVDRDLTRWATDAPPSVTSLDEWRARRHTEPAA